MSRVHLVEIEDLAGCPAAIRDGALDFLRASQTWIDQTQPVAPVLARLIEATGARRVVDLCSGGGGPLALIAAQLAELGHGVPFLMTDLYPNEVAFERARAESDGRVDFVKEGIDASRVPPELDGVRTLFNGFHHFHPELARAVLRDAAEQRQPIAVFELLQRRPLSLLSVTFGAIASLLIGPFTRPFRIAKLILCWPIPLIPLVVLWDGIVSCLRVYSPDELRGLVADIDLPGYVFEAGVLPNPSSPVPITWLTGRPVDPA